MNSATSIIPCLATNHHIFNQTSIKGRSNAVKFDRRYGFPSYVGSGARETNHQTCTEDGQQYVYSCKIVAVPQDAVKYPPSAIPGYTHVWRTPEGKETGPDIWGEFAVILETESGSGTLYRSPAGPGSGSGRAFPALRLGTELG